MSFDPEKITFFAKTDARGANVPFGIKAKDRTRHMYVIGKTGMGKSTLLENMAVQDMQNGEGMAFIDPHGQTAETLLDYVPEERKDDVLYFAPFDTDCPVAFNVMEDVGADRRHLVVSGLMSVFKKIWVDAWSARMEYILQNTLLALLEYPDSTLLGVNRMLSDKKYRKKVIDNISDPAVKAFWVDEFLNYNERYMQEAGDSIKNKIGQFTANPLIRNIIGQPKSSFDLRKIMDEKKILIMNLSKGLVGESNANLLGSMLTTRIYLAAMSRADTSAEDLKQLSNFYFYVDEFQSFANATFADILSEARKYKLNLTIAHQYVEQMEEEVRNAVFGNVGTIVSFRVGPFDAETLETIYAPQFYAVDICNLGFAQIYLTLMIDGIGSKPFSATTLPPIEAKSESCKQMVIHASRMQFASTRVEVEDAINTWMNEPVGGDASGGKPEGGQKSDGGPRSGGDRRGKSGDFKRDDRPPRRDNERSRDDRPARPAKSNGENKEKKLEDLRSILQTISPKEEKSEKSVKQDVKSSNKDETKGEKETKHEDKKVEKRRDDLAAAIKQTVSSKSKPAPDKPKEVRPETKKESLDNKHSKEIFKADQKDRQPKKERPEGQERSKEKPREQPREQKRTEKIKERPKKEKHEERSEQSGQNNEPKEASSLRNALAAVLHEPRAERTESSNEEIKEQKTVVVSEVVKQTEKQAADTATKSPVAPEKVVNEYKEIKNRDPLDPKKLERMMRVTTADKTPLK